NRRLGMGYHQLRLVGRYRSRRNADLGDPFAVPPEVENVDQPRCGSHDDLRGDLCRVVSAGSQEPPLVRLLLGASASERVRLTLGELQLTALVGRICDLDLLHGFAGVLVHGTYSRLRYDTRPRYPSGCHHTRCDL